MQVIFSGVRPSERVLKLSSALRNAGVTTSGVFQARHADEDYLRYFHSFREEPSVDVAIKFISKSAASIIHVTALAADPFSLKLFGLSSKKVVFDFKDVFPGIHPGVVPEGVELAQRFLMQRADGLVLRDGQAWLSARLSGFRLTEKKILFPDFCWPEWDIPGQFREVEIKDTYKLVHIGMTQDEILRPDRSGAGQRFVFDALLSNGHEIHFFPGPMNAQKPYPSLHQLSQKYPGRFFFRPTLPDTKLNIALQDFDFGLRISQSYLFPRMPVYWNTALNRYGVGARLYSYLSAGLPIIATPDDRAPRVAAMMGLGVLLTSVKQTKLTQIIRDSLSTLNPSERRREKILGLTVNRRIDRLIRFYKSL